MDWYLLACSVFLVIGLVLNVSDGRMLLLTLVVGAGFFSPIPGDTAQHFYLSCIAVEIMVGIAAYSIDPRVGSWIADLAIFLVFAHLMGLALDGNPPFSPYRFLVKLLEASQILVCVVRSPVLLPILRNHGETTT